MGFWVNNFEAEISGSHTSPAQHGMDTHATHQRQGGVGVHREIVPSGQAKVNGKQWNGVCRDAEDAESVGVASDFGTHERESF